MIDVLKSYVKYAKTLNYNQLVEEGKFLSTKLIGTAFDPQTGEMISQEKFKNTRTAIINALCFSTLYNGLSEREIEFICITLNTGDFLLVSTNEVKDIIREFISKNYSEATDNFVDVMETIEDAFTKEDDILTLAKYIILLCASDGNISFYEKNFIKVFKHFFE